MLVVLVVIIMLGMAEGAVQFRQWLSQGHSGKISDLFEQQGDLRVLIPGAATRTISINSLGFRGPPLSPEKPAGTVRIAFVGASTTFCAEVSGNEMTWPHLVTEVIQKEYPDVNVDYVNAAAPGYSVKTSLLNFRRRVAPLQPDITVIYHATNDLSWETRSLAKEQGIYAEPRKEKKSWLADHSQLWYLAMKNLHIKEAQRNVQNTAKQLEFSASDLGSNFRKYLIRLVSEASKVSSVVALATFSHQLRPEQTPEQQLKAAGSALYYMPFMNPQGLMDAFQQYNRIIAEVAAATGAILVSGEQMIPGNDEYFNDTVHFKDAGSQIMANRIGEALLKTPGLQSLIAARQTED